MASQRQVPVAAPLGFLPQRPGRLRTERPWCYVHPGDIPAYAAKMDKYRSTDRLVYLEITSAPRNEAQEKSG